MAVASGAAAEPADTHPALWLLRLRSIALHGNVPRLLLHLLMPILHLPLSRIAHTREGAARVVPTCRRGSSSVTMACSSLRRTGIAKNDASCCAKMYDIELDNICKHAAPRWPEVDAKVTPGTTQGVRTLYLYKEV